MASPDSENVVESPPAEEPQPKSDEGAQVTAESLEATVNMIELFDKTVAEHDATFVVFYRGIW